MTPSEIFDAAREAGFSHADLTLQRFAATIEAKPREKDAGICPENEMPCDSGCTGGWCRTLFGIKPAKAIRGQE